MQQIMNPKIIQINLECGTTVSQSIRQKLTPEQGSGTSIRKTRRMNSLEYVKLFNSKLDDKVYNVSFCLMNSLVEDNVCLLGLFGDSSKVCLAHQR